MPCFSQHAFCLACANTLFRCMHVATDVHVCWAVQLDEFVGTDAQRVQDHVWLWSDSADEKQ